MLTFHVANGNHSVKSNDILRSPAIGVGDFFLDLSQEPAGSGFSQTLGVFPGLR